MKKVVTLVIAAGLLHGCASSVKHIDLVEGHQLQTSSYQTEKGFNKVSLELNSDAKNKLADNLKFNPDQLRTTVTRALEARSLVHPEADYTVDIVITDIRVRSNFSAIMFGFMAGADSVTGTVTIHDRDKMPIKSFEVEASYALGGIGGGQDEARMGWLYEKFAEHTLNELSPKNVKTAAIANK